MLTGVNGATCSALLVELGSAFSSARLDCGDDCAFSSFLTEKAFRSVAFLQIGMLLLSLDSSQCWRSGLLGLVRFVSVIMKMEVIGRTGQA